MKKIKNLLAPNNWGIIKIIRDINNFRDWIQTIKKQESDYKSQYHLFKLRHNFFYTIYTIVSLDESEIVLPEDIKKVRVLETISPLNRYLDEDLGFAECLSPEIFNFYDDKNNQTLSYMVTYRFIFNKLSIKWAINWIIVIGFFVFLCLRFNLLDNIISIIKNII